MPSDPQVRVLVVEDALVAREGMRAVIDSLPGLSVVAVAQDAPSARAALAHASPDLVITDIRMPPTHRDEGITLADDIALSHPRTAVLAVSQYCDPPLATRLFADPKGRGYLLKDRIADADVLRDAIRTVMAGGTAIDPSIVAGMVVDGRGRGGVPMDGLTPREAEALSLMARGRSNAAIARELGITRKGVEKHISRVFEKLGLGADGDTNPRVAATLLWLEGQGDATDHAAA